MPRAQRPLPSQAIDDAVADVPSGSSAPIAELVARATTMGEAVMLTSPTFTGKAQLFDMGCLRMCDIDCQAPMIVDGRAVGETDWKSGGEVHLLVQHQGAMTINRIGRTRISIGAGQWCIISRVGRFWAETHEPALTTLLAIPGEELRSVADPLTRVTDRALRPDSASARLFYSFVHNLVTEAPHLEPPARISFGYALTQMLRATILDLADTYQAPVARERTYARMVEVIENNLGRSDLSVGMIADIIGCSPRYLHRTFGSFRPDQSIARYIRDQRLERCRVELSLCYQNNRSIADVAYKWGFPDPSHFARLFRQAYGVSPNAVVRTPRAIWA